MVFESLLRPGINAILVKGTPGAGKTTFAFQLLKTYGRGLYASTRVSKDTTSLQIPKMKDLIQKGEGRVDANTDPDQFKFQDLRLGTPRDIIQSVINAAAKIPTPMIIFDAWDAIAKEVDGMERLKVEKSILVLAESNKARLVFISEEPELTTTDYLVDAVIVLKDEAFDGRRARRIEWKKLRGSPIPQRSYLYTLNDGNFTMFESPKIRYPNEYQAKAFEPIKHNEQYYSTGSPDLDTYLGGGIRKGSIFLVELGQTVAPDWYMPIITSIACNFLSNGGCCLNIPSVTVSPDMVKESVRRHISEDILKSSLRIGHFGDYKQDPSFFKMDTKLSPDLSAIFLKRLEQLKAGKKPCFVCVSVETPEYLYGIEAVLKLGIEVIQNVKLSRDVLFGVVKPGTPSLTQLSNLSDVHLKLDEVDSSLIIYSKKPPSQLYNVEYDYREGYPKVKLVPLV